MISSKVSRAHLRTTAVSVLLRRLLYGVFLVTLVALAAALAAAAVPRLLGYPTLVVSGGSMSEFAPNGSLVIARWTAAEDVEPGDVIVIQEETDSDPAPPKIHRVVSLEVGGGQILVQTKGDSNETVDPNPYVLPDRVLTPAYTLPYVGLVATPLGWALVVALPATLLCIVTIRRIWAEERRPADTPGVA